MVFTDSLNVGPGSSLIHPLRLATSSNLDLGTQNPLFDYTWHTIAVCYLIVTLGLSLKRINMNVLLLVLRMSFQFGVILSQNKV